MKSVPVDQLIALFQKMYQEHWAYNWFGHEEGLVGCAGAFVYAFSQYGIKYPNGSNAIERGYIVGELLPISEAKPGMAAFKFFRPGEKGYDLPDKYKEGGAAYNGDLNDYHHIGLVDEDTKYVLNAKGEKYGFCRDQLTAKNGWDCVAFLKYVDYGKEQTMVDYPFGEFGKVVLPEGASGSTVNLRSGASTKNDIIAKVPVGAKIDILEDAGKWCKIEWNGIVGYMMSNYIEYDGQGGEDGTLTDADRQNIDAALKKLEQLADVIREQADIIGSVVGRG